MESITESLNKVYRLNDPGIVRYFKWIGGIFTGDWGVSLLRGRESSELIAEALPVTLYIGFVTFIISAVFGCLLGTWAAVKHPSLSGYIVYYSLNIARSFLLVIILPIFLILLFGVWLEWLPIAGYIPITEDFWPSIQRLVLPVASLAIVMIPAIALRVRTGILTTLQYKYNDSPDYGIPENHTFTTKIALLLSVPLVLNSAGVISCQLMMNLLIVEVMYNIPGLGRLILQSTYAMDYWVVQNLALVYGLIIITFTLVIDILHAVFNTRLREGRETDVHWRQEYI